MPRDRFTDEERHALRYILKLIGNAPVSRQGDVARTLVIDLLRDDLPSALRSAALSGLPSSLSDLLIDAATTIEAQHLEGRFVPKPLAANFDLAPGAITDPAHITIGQ